MVPGREGRSYIVDVVPETLIAQSNYGTESAVLRRGGLPFTALPYLT